MSDTPISLLKIILAEVENKCTCDCPFDLPAATERRCLHCRIKTLVLAHEAAEIERHDYWTRVQELKRELEATERMAGEYRELLTKARLI